MGADFIGACVPITRTRDEAFVALSKVPNTDVLKAVKNQFDSELVNGDQARSIARSCLTEVYDAHEGTNRECSTWNFGGIDYLITGGMSSGDPPTDMCQTVWLIDALGVTRDREPILATDLADLMDENSEDGQWEGADICDALGALIDRYKGWKHCAGTDEEAGHGAYSASKDKCPWNHDHEFTYVVTITTDSAEHAREALAARLDPESEIGFNYHIEYSEGLPIPKR